jgi:hypothetical protein
LSDPPLSARVRLLGTRRRWWGGAAKGLAGGDARAKPHRKGRGRVISVYWISLVNPMPASTERASRINASDADGAAAIRIDIAAGSVFLRLCLSGTYRKRSSAGLFRDQDRSFRRGSSGCWERPRAIRSGGQPRSPRAQHSRRGRGEASLDSTSWRPPQRPRWWRVAVLTGQSEIRTQPLRSLVQIPTKSPADSEMMSPGDTR